MRSRNCWRRAGRLMAALVKYVVFLTACAISTSSLAADRSNPALIAATAEAATSCVLSASKQGVSTDRFTAGADWLPSEDGTGFRHRTLPVAVTFPKDADGVARICEVRATFVSQLDQTQLINAFRVLLPAQPIQQSDSLVWMLNSKTGPRGLQIFPDKTSDQPKVRLVGAAF